MTRAGVSKNKADDEHLKEIADAVGVGVGVGDKIKKKTIKTLTGRQRGQPIDVLTRRRVAMRILLHKKSERATRTVCWRPSLECRKAPSRTSKTN